MQFIFNGYQMPTTDAVKDAAGIVAHYRQFSEKAARRARLIGQHGFSIVPSALCILRPRHRLSPPAVLDDLRSGVAKFARQKDSGGSSWTRPFRSR
jgi:hypothetical protein